MYIYTYIHVYIYIYIHTHTHIYIYVRVYILYRSGGRLLCDSYSNAPQSPIAVNKGP